MDAGAVLRKLVGGLLIAAGVLIGLTGGLFGGFGALWAFGNWTRDGQWDLLLPSLIGGALSIAVGVALVLFGRSLLRRTPEDGRAGGWPDW